MIGSFICLPEATVFEAMGELEDAVSLKEIAKHHVCLH